MDSLPLLGEIVAAGFLVLAGVFGLVGSFGLAKLPDPMTRLHGPTMATTLGIGAVLIASMIYFLARDGRVSAHELLIAVFLFLTAPITGLFIAKVHLHLRERQQDLPPPPGGVGWAGYTVEGPARGVRPPPAAQDEADQTGEGPPTSDRP